MRVVACGLATLDVVQTVEHVPAPDEKLVAADVTAVCGGPATNAAVIAAALGVDAHLISRVGTSPLGTLVAADLHAHAVTLVDAAGPDDHPAVSTVLITSTTGERAVVSVNATMSGRTPAPEHLAGEIVEADVVLVDGHHLDLAIPVASAARAAGVPVLADAGSWKPGLENLLALVDVAVISADLHVPEWMVLPEGIDPTDPVAAVAALGPNVVAQSHGPDPITAIGNNLAPVSINVPTTEVVDTLGAGDVLHGALAAWIAARGVDGVLAGLSWAAQVASASVAAPGARGWLTDAATLDTFRTSLRP